MAAEGVTSPQMLSGLEADVAAVEPAEHAACSDDGQLASHFAACVSTADNA